MARLDDVRDALAEAEVEILSKPNVVAVGVGRKVTGGRQTDELAIVASVRAKQPPSRLADGELHILSNNHVLANSNDAEPGDAILQPGSADDGSDPADRIALLSDFVPIEFDDPLSDCPVARTVAGVANAVAAELGSDTRLRAVRPLQQENLVDGAIARSLDPADVVPEILEIGAVAGLAEGELDTAVQKSAARPVAWDAGTAGGRRR